MNVRTNISIGFLLSVAFAMLTVLSNSQPLPLDTQDNGPDVPLKVSSRLSAASIVLFKEFGLTSDSLKSGRSYSNISLPRIKAALHRGADVNAVSLSGFTPLWLAADADRTDIVEFLLNHGARIDGKGVLQETPLFRASEVGLLSMVQLLVKRGADTNARNANGFTALIFAQVCGKIDVMKVLLAHHANVNLRDSCHKTVLGYALAERPRHPEVIQMLQKYGATE